MYFAHAIGPYVSRARSLAEFLKTRFKQSFQPEIVHLISYIEPNDLWKKYKTGLLTLSSDGISRVELRREVREPQRFCFSFFWSSSLNLSFSCWRLLLASSSFFWLSTIESILPLILSMRRSCRSCWACEVVIVMYNVRSSTMKRANNDRNKHDKKRNYSVDRNFGNDANANNRALWLRSSSHHLIGLPSNTDQ